MTTTTVDAGPTPGKVYLVTLDDMGPDGKPYWYIDCEIGARAGMHFPDATTIVDPENGILTEADAKFIVHAWNSHADLVKALEELVGFLRGTNTYSTRGAHIEISRLCGNAEVALASAKGQP